MAIVKIKRQLKTSWLGRYRLYSTGDHISLPAIMLLCCIFAHNSFGSPWIETGDEQIRHHIQTLADDGFISSPTNSWPLMWSNIKADLDKIQPSELNDGQLWSYRYLKYELRKAMNSFRVEQSIQAGNRVTAIGDFSTDSRERYQSSFAANYTGDELAYKAKMSYIYSPADGQAFQADGSYVNYLAGNWVIGAGLIDRWWGPGWESSLILSNNARPTPGIYLQRHLSTAFETPLLSWIGPWQMTTFMTELESRRDYPNAKLWGMRVNAKPFKEFELGMSRTAQWGGREKLGVSRPNDIDTFVRLLFGDDNVDPTVPGEAPDRSREPGNQLAGFDWRWGHTVGQTSGSLYGQLVGEDEAGYMPSRSIGMAGIELGRLVGDIHGRLNLEAQNTRVYFYDAEKRKEFHNTAYEHSVYYSGYRFHGRPIGAATDNDSESLTLRGQAYFRNGHNLNISLGDHHLNVDGTNTIVSPLAGQGGSIFGYRKQENAFVSTRQDTFKTQITYTLPINDVFLLEVSAFNYSKSVSYRKTQLKSNDTDLLIKINTGGFIRLRASY